MMLYDFIKPLVNIFYHTYYDIEMKGMEKIPYGKPVVLASNHTNAFVDPVVLAMTLKQKVRFYARGDAFKGPVLKWLLNQMNMSPIYRAQDGFTGSDKNDKTFAECRDRLRNKETLLLYPEGICIQEKRLQPVKKGLSRILFDTSVPGLLETDVLIIPAGLNYSNAKKFRSKVFINIGDPISTDKFKADHVDGSNKLYLDFTQKLSLEMTNLIVTINNKEDDELVENITEIYLNQFMDEHKLEHKSLEKHFLIRKKIANIINQLSEADPENRGKLNVNVSEYITKLNENKLRDHLLRPEAITNSSALHFVREFIILWLGLPIYALGLFINYPPYYLAKQFATSKIKKREFFASAYLNIAMFAWIFYYGIQLVTVALVFKNWAVLGLYAAITPLLGVYVLTYYPIMKKIFGKWNLLRLARKNREVVAELMSLRTSIINQLDEAKSKYDSLK
jgi:glycerol-3-phosphate O-acyltransferase / dihydroxyacetone phosphate acyltransferase